MNDVASISVDDAFVASADDEISFEMIFQRKADLRVLVHRASLPKAEITKIYEVVLKYIAQRDIGETHNFVAARDVAGGHLATGEGLWNFVVTIVAQAERRMRADLDDRGRKGF
ncbi:MAG: hypothetical protein K2X45_18515 [Phreatobacter sp.]|jgi:hypothetical protein|nr:hypothetical protein [Phreatobacter sp.]